VNDPCCWGIFRERTHSPGRESDDAEILRLTAKHLEALGFAVSLKAAEEVETLTEARPECVFLMCEGAQVLRRLEAWQAGGVRQVNDPVAVLNTYRDRMIGQFAEANVPFIESRVVSTATSCANGFLPVWVKRADVHNTQGGDVVFAASEDAVASALGGLAERGIARAVLQPHVEGDLIKFYGIGRGGGPDGEPPWFRFFYHKGQQVAGHPFDPQQLARLVRRAAAALGLEVYGGDAIATPTGALVLLDLNAWPSFALYRDEAALAIAAYLTVRFRGNR
jgi:glutathione synthase/RimK-type ligase-like ATP-grasp enzyme